MVTCMVLAESLESLVSGYHRFLTEAAPAGLV